jgi:hypothetical protein
MSRFVFGVLLLTLGVGILTTGLLDLGMYLAYGSSSTLSQHIANSVDQSAGMMLVIGGGCFTLGMLATHFTSFRMRPVKKAQVAQVGGGHYGGLEFQHWDLACLNGWCYPLAAATKYLYRHERKAGVEDLKKAISYIDFMQEAWPPGEWADGMERVYDLDWPTSALPAVQSLARQDWTALRAAIQLMIEPEGIE